MFWLPLPCWLLLPAGCSGEAMTNKTSVGLSGLLAAAAAWLATTYDLDPTVAGLAVWCGLTVALAVLPDDVEARLAEAAKRAAGIWPALLLFLAGCAGGPVAQCYHAAGAYEVAQIAIEGAVYSPTIPLGTKKTLQEIDAKAVDAAGACRDAAIAADDNETSFYTGILSEALIQSRALIAAEVQREQP